MSVIVDSSSLPIYSEAFNSFEIKSGWCTSEYSLVASSPAYLTMTIASQLLLNSVSKVKHWAPTVRSSRMLRSKPRHVVYFSVDYNPKVVWLGMLGQSVD